MKQTGIILALVGLALWFAVNHPGRTAPAAAVQPLPRPVAQVATFQIPPEPADETVSVTPPGPSAHPDPRTVGSPLAGELNSPSGTGGQDVETLHTLLRQYLVHLGRRQGRPIGNDSDLARVLTGGNPMKLVLLPPSHSALNPDGRLRDRWGTPYFIHPRGRNAFEIRSAGPDRKLFTADDLVANPPSGLSQNEPQSR